MSAEGRPLVGGEGLCARFLLLGGSLSVIASLFNPTAWHEHPAGNEATARYIPEYHFTMPLASWIYLFMLGILLLLFSGILKLCICSEFINIQQLLRTILLDCEGLSCCGAYRF